VASRKIDWVRISAIFGILASLGGMAGFFFSKDTQRCVGLNGAYRGHPLRAIEHCADDRTLERVADAPPSAQPDDTSTDPRRLAGTRWIFYVGDTKTIVTFNADSTVTFSDPAYGTNGIWELAGTRGVAFHTDTYDFGATIGRGVPDSFDVSYRHLPRGSDPEAEQKATFTRIADVASSP
jgi:hypothetical protein